MGRYALSNFLGLISIDPWTIIVSACNLLIIYFVIKKFFYAPVMKIIKEREEQIKEQYSEADKAKKEAEESRAVYSERVKHAEEDADEIIKNAHKEAKKISNEIVSEADRKAEAMREKAEEDIRREKARAEAELKKEIADISVDIANKVVGREVNKNDHERFIDDFINGIGEKDSLGEENDG